MDLTELLKLPEAELERIRELSVKLYEDRIPEQGEAAPEVPEPKE